MPQERLPFRLRIKKAFHAANAAVTPASLVEKCIEAIVFVSVLWLAMKITGLEPFLTLLSQRIML